MNLSADSRSVRHSNVVSPQNSNDVVSPPNHNDGAPKPRLYLTDEDERKLQSAVIHITVPKGDVNYVSTGTVVKYGLNAWLETCFHSLAVDGVIDQSKLGSVVATLGHTRDGAVAGERLKSVDVENFSATLDLTRDSYAVATGVVIRLVSDRGGSWILADRGLDVALVRIFDLPASCTPALQLLAPPGFESRVGDPIDIIGHPDGFARRTSKGVITALTEDELTHSAPITFGSSGSMVFNGRTHEIVGMVTTTAGALPIAAVRSLIHSHSTYAEASACLYETLDAHADHERLRAKSNEDDLREQAMLEAEYQRRRDEMAATQKARREEMRIADHAELRSKVTMYSVDWVAGIVYGDLLGECQDEDRDLIKRVQTALAPGLALLKPGAKRKHGEI